PPYSEATARTSHRGFRCRSVAGRPLSRSAECVRKHLPAEVKGLLTDVGREGADRLLDLGERHPPRFNELLVVHQDGLCKCRNVHPQVGHPVPPGHAHLPDPPTLRATPAPGCPPTGVPHLARGRGQTPGTRPAPVGLRARTRTPRACRTGAGS